MKYSADNISSACVFKNKSEAVEHAAYMVACFWLTSADKIIARGDEPCKLSECGLTLAQSEMDRDIYGRFRKHMDSTIIRSRALQFARAKLAVGQFVNVSNYFGTDNDPDRLKLDALALEQVGELRR